MEYDSTDTFQNIGDVAANIVKDARSVRSGKRRPTEELIKLERLKAVLSYDKETGIFRWKVSTSNRVRVGQIAGSPDPRGYIRIHIDGKFYVAQRLAWFFVTGEWPDSDIDHKNEDKSDNRFCNLRPASRSQNMANTGLQKNTSHGFKGVSFVKTGPRLKRYFASITVNGERVSLGYYMTAAEAGDAYAKAHKEYHGEFSKMEEINVAS